LRNAGMVPDIDDDYRPRLGARVLGVPFGRS